MIKIFLVFATAINIFAVPPFPVCSAGLIDVDMAVHQPWHQDVITHVLDILAVGFLNFDIDTMTNTQ